MAFDQSTRNRLNTFVSNARALLSAEFTRQLQSDYGLDPKSGRVDDVVTIRHLTDHQRETARILRDTLHHYTAGKTDKRTRVAALDRIVREQAFTVLNRLAALRMAEARGLLITSVGAGTSSDGFQLYKQLAGIALGESDQAYTAYLFSLFDEFAVDLAVLFDRFAPEGRLFPQPTALRQLLALINDAEIAPLWAEDETIGWIYQYFNSADERRAMRKASQAPRNSRELAVRNQFFTPRYVVEFLTDNTLGRIWYEMTQGQTRLVEQCRYMVRRPNEVFLAEGEEPPVQQSADNLTQEELLNQTVYIPYRPRKDPRTIKMLDPACGSMHFGLYAFDLFETIYTEAYRRGDSLLRPISEEEGRSKLAPLRDVYDSEAALRRDVPRLIIEHNIHGIDIDARAAQIAGLSLWLRAQRSWQGQGVAASDRPIITRSNVVVAEPMPGDAAELEQFLEAQLSDTAQDRIVAALVRKVFDGMRLAGEAGALLKIEETIAADIAAAREQWARPAQARQGTLFASVQQGTLPLDAPPPTDAAFWAQVETRIYAALQQFAERAEQGASFRRRLFADDAARGFAFIDLCRQRYDVVLMNPPFGDAAKSTEMYLRKKYKNWNFNVFCAFTVRMQELADGYVGAITDRAFMLKTSYEKYRKNVVLQRRGASIVVDLGWEVLDANVEVNVQIFGGSGEAIWFADLMLVDESKQQALQKLSQLTFHYDWHVRDRAYFYDLPNHILSYKLPAWQENARNLGRRIDSNFAIAYSGLKAGKIERFLRVTWEINEFERGTNSKWPYFQNGSPYSPYYFPTVYLIHHERNWRHIRPISSSRITGIENYGQAGITYGKRTDFIYGFVLPSEQIFSNEGMNVIPKQWEYRYELLALLNSSSLQKLMNLISGQHKAHSYLNKVYLTNPLRDRELSRRCELLVNSLMEIDSTNEISLHFILPYAPSNNKNEKIEELYLGSETQLHKLLNEYQELSKKVAHLLGDDSTEDVKDVDWYALYFEQSLSTHLISLNYIQYLAGVIFGRWDIQYATGAKEPPPLPDPFDPLPVCPPGMLQNADGLPAAPSDVSADYPLRITRDGILVDDDGHAEDVVGRVREALRVIWPDNADDIEAEAVALLGVDSLRDYFGNPNKFFADHLSRYGKSRRVAPIYWPLTTRNGAYTLWLYYHRLSDGTLYQCVNDFVDPKLTAVNRQLIALRSRQRDRSDERELERLTDLADELTQFRADLLHLATFWRPNLNDGVQISAAPLHALFGNKKWRDKLSDTWDKLQAGEYDWAHLAMSVWPSRVVPKCVDDRSLAIAHDVETLFWVEEDGNWRKLLPPDQERARLVEQRQSDERERLRDLFDALAREEGRDLSAQQVWQSLNEGHWDARPLGIHLFPERAVEAAFDDSTRFFRVMDERGRKLLQKNTKKNKNLLTKRLIAQGSPELVEAVGATLANEAGAFAAVWRELAAGLRDDAPLALALWPQRVIDKATHDVALAATHGVRDFLWYDDPAGGWRLRLHVDREITQEVDRRGGDQL